MRGAALLLFFVLRDAVRLPLCVVRCADCGLQTGTLSRGSKKSLVDTSGISESSRFSGPELDWLALFFSNRFGGKAPALAELLRVFPALGEHEALVGQLFRVLDRNRNGALDFEELVHGCSVAGRGTLDQKLGFLFILFDGDEDRIVAQNDVRSAVQQIGRFMIRDGRLAARVYSRDEALDIFHGAETLLLDRFKQRAVSNAVMENCMRFLDAVFFPVVQAMESDVRSAQLFERPLNYVVTREDGFVPAVIQAVATRLTVQPTDLATLFQVRMDDERCVRLCGKVEAAWMDMKLTQLLPEAEDVTLVAAVLKKFLNDLPEPLFPFVLYPDVLALEKNATEAGVEAIVKQLPPTNFASLSAIVALIRALCTAKGTAPLVPDECLKLCVVLGPLMMRPKKVDDDNETRVRHAKTVARVLRLIVAEDMLGALDAEKAALRQAEKKLAETRRDLLQAREELQTTSASLSAAKMESAALAERVALQSTSTQKMAQRLAELRQELTAVKMESIQSPATARSASDETSTPPSSRGPGIVAPEKSVAKAVGEWLEGPGAVQGGDADAVEVIARHEMREKETLRKRTMSKQMPADAYDKLFEGALDPVTITVEVFCARGLTSKDGKCDAYPKAALRLVGEGKVLRKRVGPQAGTRSTDPVWNAKFAFVVSASRLEEMVLQVSVFHADKFGRDAFLGIVYLPLVDVAGQNLQDWFPFKQRKPTDKVSGELHMRVANSAHGVPLSDMSDGAAAGSGGGKVELYSAVKVHRSTSAPTSSEWIMKLTTRCTSEELHKMYMPEEPNTPEVIVFDQIRKSLVLAVTRDKYIALLANQARIQKEPDFLLDALLTVETWTSSENFLLMLMSRYVGPDKTSAEYAEFEPTSRAVQGGVIKVLFEWINNHYMAQDFFKTPGLKEMMLQFSQEQGVSLRALNMPAKQSDAAVRRRTGSVIGTAPDLATRSRREESVFELPANNVAEQLTLIEFSLLADIKLSELCGQAWNKEGKEERALNVLQYIAWFNRVSRWVVTLIITQREALERSVAITKIIELGVALSVLNNYNGVIEILSALHSSAISRLKETWSLVHKDTMAKLEELDQLMNTEGNFRYYRALLEKSKPPIVPYMGLLLTDLTFMDDANLTETGKGDKGHKLLNLEKIRMLAGVYRLFRKCLIKPYGFPEMRSVRKLLLNIEGFDDNELYRLSKLRENGSALSGSGGGGTAGSPHVAVVADKRQRKLISQMTSTMLVRNKLEVADDCMSAKDWEQLQAMEGVELLVRKRGEVLLQANAKSGSLLHIKSGSVSKSFAGNAVGAAGPKELVDVLAVLDPNKPKPFETVVTSDVCEVYSIPLDVVHAFTADLELSRKLFGTLAQNQVGRLLELNKFPLSLPASNKSAENAAAVELAAWDVAWRGKADKEQREYEYSGVLILYATHATLSSRMMGFLKSEKIVLRRVQSCAAQGNAACIVSLNKRGEEVRRLVKCLAGFSETEQVIARIEAAAAAARIVEGQEQDEEEEEEESGHESMSDAMALKAEDWAVLTQGAKKVVVKRDEAVMKEGESYQRMYQIVRGVIRVEKKINDETKMLGRLRASETFGELSFLVGSAATATCLADSEEVELTIMEGYYLNMLFQIRPEIAGRFYKFLSMLVTARILSKLQ